MKKIFPSLFLLSIFVITSSLKMTASSYSIDEIYCTTSTRDIKALTANGELIDAKYVLEPYKRYQPGKYVINVTRKAKDLYQIEGKDIFIKTRYCDKYATREDAFLVVESNYGYTRGQLIFP